MRPVLNKHSFTVKVVTSKEKQSSMTGVESVLEVFQNNPPPMFEEVCLTIEPLYSCFRMFI